MAGDSDQNNEPEWLRNLPLRSEEIGFTADQLIKCKKCGKSIAPNRASCMYCGTEVPGRAAAKIDAQALENWENGFNVILIDTTHADIDRSAVQLASLLSSERESVRSILTAGRGVPLCRVRSEAQAEQVTARLEEFGIRFVIVADDSLQPTAPPTRLRSISFDGDTLNFELFNIGEIRSLGRDELAVIVPGVILEGRTESVERRKRRGPQTLSETETSSDQPVIDIYSSRDPLGWRIPAAGFDFSCLGMEKSLLVAENMKKLTSRLVEFAPQAQLAGDYVKLRSMLESSWPSDSRRDTQQVGLNRKDISKVFTTSNSAQFTKYSRLQWRLYEKKV